MRALAERLEGILDVEWDLMNADNIQMVKGDGTIAVRITPDDKTNEYVVQMLAAPLPDGQIRFPAGEGDEVIYDQFDGQTIAITRDLVAEQLNYEITYD